MSIAERLLKELREREDLKEALANELLTVIFKNRKLRLSILTALYRDIATKDDLKELRREIQYEIEELRSQMRSEMRELRSEINELRNSIAKLEQRVVRLEGMMNLFIKLFIAFNVPILIGIIGILLKMIFSP